MAFQAPSFLQDDPFPSLPRSSSWSTIESASTHHRKKSKNPYRQGGDEEVPGTRKKTPIRAVFDDLPTAHSSITSGKITKPRAIADDATHTASIEDEHSIPLQELDATNRQDDFFSNLPLPPLPAILSEGRYDRGDRQATDADIMNHCVQISPSLHLVEPGLPNSMFENIKNALAAISSPLTRDAPPDRPTSGNWPRDSLDFDDNVQRRSLRRVERKSGQERNYNPLLHNNASEEARCGDAGPSKPRHASDTKQSSIYHSSLGDAPSESLSSRNQQYPENAHMSKIDHHIGSQGRKFSSGAQSFDFPLLPRPQNPTLPHERPKIRSASTDESLPEGSTVGNIYRHYVGSDGLDQFSDVDDDSEPSLPDLNPMSRGIFNGQPTIHGIGSTSSSNDQLRPSALFVRKQRRAAKQVLDVHRQPPKFSLPKVPDLTSQQLAPKSTQGLEQSSSYGDTRNLLEITQRANWANYMALISRSDGRADLRSDQAISEIQEAFQPSLHQPNPSDPFQTGHSPQVVLSKEDGHVVINDNINFDSPMVDRLPLEREVSEALRRASGFSAYSNGSIISSVLECYGESVASISQSIGMLRRQKIEDSPPSDSESIGDDTRVVVEQAKAFYDQGAVPLNWVTTRQNNVVRVPINHNGSMPDSPPNSPPHDAATSFGHRQPTPEGDHNDWETVGESAFGFDVKSSKEAGLIGGTINRAGSSIANTSDEGTASSHVPKLEDFGSTERIAQHPAHIRYFGDYRQRDLKKSHIPVFLPVFREHKINGYLADSTRTRPPPPPFNFAPPRLARTHTNPFQSSPPEVKPSIRTVKPSSVAQHQRGHNANHFQRSLQTLNTESDEAEQRMGATAERSRQTLNWMDDFGEPGPTINTRKLYLRSPNPGLASQSDNNDTSSVTGGNPHSIVYSSKLHRASGLQGKNQTDGLAEGRSIGGRSLTKNNQKRSPLVKGPPGAFYQGLRSKPGDSKRRSWSEQRDRPISVFGHQSSIRGYPTNTLRPLSLLKAPRLSTLVTSTERRPSEDILENDFVYRSPLAPLKRDSWKKLYSKQQLRGINDAAKADGLVETQVQQAAGLLKEGGSRKHLFETPTLKLWKRDDSTRTDLSHKKKNFSIIVLCLCVIFPPMLILYALGSLDGIIMWWTSGEYSTFAKQQKRWAYILLCCWGVATFIGLVAFLIYWFSSLRSPG